MLFTLVWLGLAGNIMIGKASEARSRHHVQAAYYAQSHIEQVLRQIPFNALSSNSADTVVGGENTATQFNATRRVTIGEIVYNGPSPMYAHVTVDIQWTESPIGRALVGVVQHEYIRTIIPNDPIGN
jgi:hypothetical protein